jgi:hypothetical protein
VVHQLAPVGTAVVEELIEHIYTTACRLTASRRY